MALRNSVRQLCVLRQNLMAVSKIVCQKSLSSSHTVAHKNLPILSTVTKSFHTSIPQRNENIINIQDQDDFSERVLGNTTPVIVDFHADWCGPCKTLGPRLESMIASKAGKVILAKVDIDANGEIAIDHGVEAVPTVIAMKDGKITDKFVGVVDDADLKSFINKLIGE